MQMMDAVWLSMLLSASAGMLAVTVVVATFYFIRCCLAVHPCLRSCWLAVHACEGVPAQLAGGASAAELHSCPVR